MRRLSVDEAIKAKEGCWYSFGFGNQSIWSMFANLITFRNLCCNFLSKPLTFKKFFVRTLFHKVNSFCELPFLTYWQRLIGNYIHLCFNYLCLYYIWGVYISISTCWLTAWFRFSALELPQLYLKAYWFSIEHLKHKVKENTIKACMLIMA